MKSHYKRIGDYVTQIKLKNTDGSISSLKGININKHFMPSVANINGTDLSKYRVVKKNQFAFNPMHVGRDEVLPISILEDDEPIIVSPAYVVFEVKDEEELLPAYLMMWCRRSEFDRNAWFMTDNSVRGGFSWADFCDMELPVPSIEKQREVVREYNVVNDRIALNEQLTQKLEDTAQAIYKQWFVDFEFPISREYAESIGKPELEGKPYKSSGGDMMYDVGSDIDIPASWNVFAMDDVADVIDSMHKTPTYSSSGKSMVRVTDVNGSYLDLTGTLKVDNKVFSEFTSKYAPKRGDVVLTRVGTYGVCSYVGTDTPFCLGQNTVVINPIKLDGSLLFFMLKSGAIKEQIEEGVTGSTQKTISLKLIRQLRLVLPRNFESFSYLQNPFSAITSKGELLVEENSKLRQMKEVLLSSLSKA